MKILHGITGMAVLAGSADATIVKRQFDFTASNFVDALNAGNTPPVDPVTGSFIIKWDTSKNSTDQTAGISLNSFDLPLDSPLSFDYDSASDFMLIGGSANGTSTLMPMHTDFVMYIWWASGNPFTWRLYYGVPGIDTAFAGDLTLTSTTLPVPEPATWAMMLGGFGAVGGMMRYRRRSVAFA